ncbi:hypothetical protein K3G63_16810 [Hymenobacter sp. HSC-4F20]|uniref:hypothetical protein n=1 Tax=Hymenobacter sp. HSC-4F20 TaxID=2864135 RepID=UPI001C737D0D|nr:hypothetical protein [Hymenobacter sp. HSC-4F20]MBX0292113.1 hypothetical protein [Hymenobacter sp. HSC-4F20]
MRKAIAQEAPAPAAHKERRRPTPCCPLNPSGGRYGTLLTGRTPSALHWYQKP